MAKLRRDTHESQLFSTERPLRIVASGTLFLTHTLSLPCQPAPSSVIRAHSVEKNRGGSASTLLSLLAQFPNIEAALVAPLGGNDEGSMVIRDLETEGVSTRFCKIWPGSGVPSAWVFHAVDSDTRTIVNHNPLPDITHEEFVSILGPLLAPENYMLFPPAESPVPATHPPSSPLPLSMSSQSSPRTPGTPVMFNPNSPAPFDWLHFEGRSVKTTLSNITGLDGLARERKWRSHCVFSVDIGRRGRQGVEALIPHADVLFVNKHYAQANSPHYSATPRTFLLSFMSSAPPHALLVAHWGSEGAAVLSLPTREYFQSSGWVEDRSTARTPSDSRHPLPQGRDTAANSTAHSSETHEVRSVRSGSDFWADGRSRTPSSSAFTAGNYTSSDARSHLGLGAPQTRSRSRPRGHGNRYNTARTEEDDNEDADHDSQGTEVPESDDNVVDEVGAQDAFVAGMIYSLSRRLLPGPPYTPASGGEDVRPANMDHDKGRWRLDECLRFATELAGRKARRRNWDGLADEMTRAGWFNNAY
ncbi:Ribokinase-like protein [Armillaria luteobubalina]|uniref:Ribokinase-like protein n=1 Tax=Armillaria luteobubalina TaxID=153913 RepID=A0AA39TTP0_9AGAR|nr:Ribokinase-like protein [Armillaria luteobubalina]